MFYMLQMYHPVKIKTIDISTLNVKTVEFTLNLVVRLFDIFK